MNRLSPVAPLVLLLAACHSPFGSGAADLAITTGETVYALDPPVGTAVVRFSVANRRGATVYVDRCGDRPMTALERREGGEWVQYSGGACPAVYDMSPLPVSPGQTLLAARSIREPGRYRLRIGVSVNPGEHRQRTATSNPFVVE